MMTLSSGPRRVQIMYGNGGGGHKASAAAIEAVLRDMTTIPAEPPLLDVVDAAAISGAAAGDWLYNVLLSYNAVSTIELMHSAVQMFMPLVLPGLRTSFRQHWQSVPDLACVVSLVPTLNAVFADTLPSHVVLLTVLTDFSHTKSHPWIQHPRQHLVIGTDIGYAQALAAGYLQPHVASASHAVTKTSGMVVHPKFYQRASEEDRGRRRKEMRLHPTLPTVLILFGGAPPTDRVVELVDAYMARTRSAPVNLIAVCARNRQLYERLEKKKKREPNQHLFVTGFSNEIPLLMQMSDLLIGKPGPGVVSEAFVSKLPCVLLTGEDESNVMKQEKDVLDWVRREGIGKVVRNAREAAAISAAEMARMKERLRVHGKNRAVFQVGELILEKCGYQYVRTEEASSSDEFTSADEGGAEASEVPEVDIGTMDETVERIRGEEGEGEVRTETSLFARVNGMSHTIDKGDERCTVDLGLSDTDVEQQDDQDRR